MRASLCLSVCADCSKSSPFQLRTGDQSARCLKCGLAFLLPLSVAGEHRPSTGSALRRLLNRLADSWRQAAAWVRQHSRRIGIQAGGGVVISLICHALLLAVFARWWLIPDQPAYVPLVAQFVEAPAAVDFSEDLLELTLPVEVEPAPTAGSPGASDPGSRMTESDVNLPSGFGDTGRGPAVDVGRGAGRGKGRGSGSGGGGEMFRGVAQVRSAAFVVDASSSMQGSRMTDVLNELTKTIGALRTDQAFFVVFFNKRPFPMMWPRSIIRLIPATEANRFRVLEWAQRVSPAHSTLPQSSMRLALGLRPEAVYFLTDGEIPFSTVNIVQRYRKPPTKVHTICVGSAADENTMQKIADITDGTITRLADSRPPSVSCLNGNCLKTPANHMTLSQP